jgi:hypothetical protein
MWAALALTAATHSYGPGDESGGRSTCRKIVGGTGKSMSVFRRPIVAGSKLSSKIATPRKSHLEFIRFLNAIEEQVPAGKIIHAIVDNYATHKHPKGAPMACSPSPLEFPLHPNFGVLAQRRRWIFCNTHKAATEARHVPISRRSPSRHFLLPRVGAVAASSLLWVRLIEVESAVGAACDIGNVDAKPWLRVCKALRNSCNSG